MRVEDLDGPRVKPGAEQKALEDLRWLGLDWDEGPDAGGPSGPYRQSERAELYRETIEKLRAKGLSYPCVCTRSEVERAASAPHAGENETRYPGTCRGRFSGAEEAEEKTGRPAAVRIRVPEGSVAFPDLFHDSFSFEVAQQCGDFVIEKVERSGPKAGLRTAAYQLACVVDDAAMRIDEVLRGDDLLSSTSRQILLQRALGVPTPRYAHLPLLVGEDGRRLAKRHGDTTIRRFREAGASPETVTGWLAAVSGLLPPGSRAHPRELVGGFSLQKVPRHTIVVPARTIQELESIS